MYALRFYFPRPYAYEEKLSKNCQMCGRLQKMVSHRLLGAYGAYPGSIPLKITIIRKKRLRVLQDIFVNDFRRRSNCCHDEIDDPFHNKAFSARQTQCPLTQILQPRLSDPFFFVSSPILTLSPGRSCLFKCRKLGTARRGAVLCLGVRTRVFGISVKFGGDTTRFRTVNFV